ncbi:MAG: MFS transporter [Oscillatoriales cyanobacterium RM1_1_9]|nr:MFS transporter [Oscillatoriales cyanobacterium SM2_3_0]NJO46367.1 MFS transporter [Oscillatoriales cyanobacterium RM2_1_1]NJO71653.1 MFS transporter [Oscillatoriales cyanobacterium RM1_1_9]
MLFSTGLFFWSSITTLMPTLPLYIQSIGGTNQQIGWVMGAFAIGLLPSRIGLGPLADSRGRKLVLIIGAFVAMAAPLGYLLVASIPPLFGIRAFHGISVAAFTIGFSALVADLAPVHRRGEVIGYMGLVAPIGMAIGPAVGGFIEDMAGYQSLFLTSSILGLVALIGVFQVQEPERPVLAKVGLEVIPSPRPNWQRVTTSYVKLLSSPPLRTPTLVMFSVGLIFGSLVTFLPLYVQASGLTLNAGLFYSTAAIASFSSRFFVGRASDRYGRGLFITLGLGFYLLSMIMLANAQDKFILLTAAVLEGTGAGIVIPTMLALITDRCPPNQRGKYFSLCVGGFDLGIALAGPIFGWIAEQAGYRNMYLLNVVLALLGMLVFMFQSSKTVKLSLKFSTGQARDAYRLDT